MTAYTLHPIGKVLYDGEGVRIALDRAYAPALEGLEGFSHVQVLWWPAGCDTPADRGLLTHHRPYRNGPRTLGTFATRAPTRPNPIALDCAQVLYIDHGEAVIGLTYIDAFDGSPVLDIKPYTPSLDRVQSPSVPAWCAHWPQSCEASGDFDWAGEMNG